MLTIYWLIKYEPLDQEYQISMQGPTGKLRKLLCSKLTKITHSLPFELKRKLFFHAPPFVCLHTPMKLKSSLHFLAGLHPVSSMESVNTHVPEHTALRKL